MKRRLFIFNASVGAACIFTGSLLACRKEEQLLPNHQLSLDLRKLLVNNADKKYEKIYLVSRISNTDNATIRRRFNTVKNLEVKIDGYIFLGNELTKISENMSRIDAGNSIYFLKNLNRPTTMSLPVKSEHFKDLSTSFHYIERSQNNSNLSIKSIKI